jgi:glycine dehydrogenase subunit 1
MIFPYIPHTDEDRHSMLDALGLSSLDDLYKDISEELLLSESVPISQGRTEDEVVRLITTIAQRNIKGISFLGCGCYDHLIPATVQAITSLPSFVTAYTPYQAEISQGLLQAIYEFQSMVCEITGMDISNASLYDGANAMLEAASVSLVSKRKATTVLVSPTIHPFSRKVLETWALGTDHIIKVLPEKEGQCDLSVLGDYLTEEVGSLIVQSPNRYGFLEDYSSVAQRVHANGSLFTISSDLLSLGIQKSPAEWGADIAIGDTQSLGLPLSFGGPSCGYMAVTKALMRKIPGRIVGSTVDSQGRRGYTLTLQAREQHIKREHASSNICSNQALSALMTTVHLSSLGWSGMEEAANQSYAKAHYLAYHLIQLPGLTIPWNTPFWCEFPLVFSDAKKMRKFIQELRNVGIFAGVKLSALTKEPKDELVLIVAVTEKRSREELELYLAAARRALK